MKQRPFAHALRNSNFLLVLGLAGLAIAVVVVLPRVGRGQAKDRARNQIREMRYTASAQQARPEIAPEFIVFNENFDSVGLPSLPANWTTSASGVISPFTTVNAFPDSPPNAAFAPDPNTQGTSELVSPSIALGNLPHKLTFRHFYQTDFEFDGCVLEMSINGGAFTDIVNAGGTFAVGGYDTVLVGGTLSSRQSWTGQRTGYITTEVNLPVSTNNQSVRFKWRIGTDNMEGGTGWWIDSVQVTNAISGTNAAAITIPASGVASSYPSTINVSGLEGPVTGVQVLIPSFSHAAPDDVDLMLVSPSGGKVVLMSDVGGTNAATNLNLFFTDTGVAMPDSGALSSTSYKPTNFEPGDAYPGPAPAGAPTGSMLAALNGTNPNGNWQLFLVDDTGGNAGSIGSGWSVFVQTSADAIVINDAATASPYSSDKRIAATAGTVTGITVTLSNFSHVSPDDVDVMLVAPNGRHVILMSDVGGTNEVGGLNLTFSDAAASGLPDSGALSSGTFKPTDFEPGEIFPAPAPATAPTGNTMAAFYGSAPNGMWKLYVVDDTGTNAGSIGGSWSMSLQTSTTACAFTIAPLSQTFPISGGSGSFGINMPSNCSWTATSAASYVTVNSSATGSGNSVVSFTVGQNLGGGRSGAIDVSNGVVTHTFQVQQPSGCPYALSQSAVNFGAAGGNGNVTVTAGAICGWQGSTGASWLHMTSGPSSGDGIMTFAAEPNASSVSRSATVTVGARSFTVNQAGAAGKKFDFDGDSKADISVYRPTGGVWYLLRSDPPDSPLGVQFGTDADAIAPADYDGDRKADLAVYRNGVWYILQSQTNTLRYENFGVTNDRPEPADYDGDGKADVAVFRPSAGTWYILRSQSSTMQTVPWGNATDAPMVGDYDGDGRADVAVYRAGSGGGQSSWFIVESSTGVGVERQFGSENDRPAPGDFDGDGRDNLTVFRPSNGTWYISQGGANFTTKQWGTAGDVPAPADYDGDGKTDHAVFRAGTWYILRSSDNGIRAQSWGAVGDRVVPAAYLP